ncbi:hypothetical protein FNT36_21765 [Hymenobacter setariae]|uniref:Outer membrane protein beta-barrel domain-containing protein n=1 Tax=Hymenobacter setariae TaxID=2594794 RepID=A0A558BMR3_9BACT|nr:hypothetical protein [Hymenobacter setariae]TVT37798.1 hypothetical protein FNT36_21765 [Hymenobacter setariae]
MRFSYAFFSLFVALCMASVAQAQRVEVIGLAASFNVSQSWARESGLQLGTYELQTSPSSVRFDDTGNRYSAYARIRLGEGSMFAQLELAYTSALSSTYPLNYPGDAGSPSDPGYQPASNAPFGYRIRRAEVAALVGRHLGPHFYALAGPVLALQQRQSASGTSSTAEVYRSLYGAVERGQLLGQVGFGFQVWRLDFGLRYEHSLTPYTREVTYLGQTQNFHQRTSQVMLSIGALLYDRSQRWRH